MKITALASTALALTAFFCIASVKCPAENVNNAAPEKDQHIYKLSELSSRPIPTKQGELNRQFVQRLHGNHSAIVNLVIEADGTASEVTLDQSSSPEFGEAAVEAAKQWQFTPATREGKVVRTKITIPFKIIRDKGATGKYSQEQNSPR